MKTAKKIIDMDEEYEENEAIDHILLDYEICIVDPLFYTAIKFHPKPSSKILDSIQEKNNYFKDKVAKLIFLDCDLSLDEKKEIILSTIKDHQIKDIDKEKTYNILNSRIINNRENASNICEDYLLSLLTSHADNIYNKAFKTIKLSMENDDLKDSVPVHEKSTIINPPQFKTETPPKRVALK